MTEPLEETRPIAEGAPFGAVGAAPEEVRRAAHMLLGLVDRTSALWPKVSIALKATCEDVERRLARDEVVIPVLGTTAQKRALFDAICGERLFGANADAPAPVVVRLRRGEALGYVATKADGSVLEPEPDRGPHLDVEIEKREGELARANDLATDLRRELGALHDSVRPPGLDDEVSPAPVPPEPTRFFGWLAAILVAVLVALRLRKPPPLLDAPARERAPSLASTGQRRAFRLDTVDSVTRRLGEVEATIETSRAALEKLRAERSTYVSDRHGRIVDQLRRFVDAKTDVTEVEVLSPALPRGLVVLDDPRLSFGTDEERKTAFREMRRELGGCILASTSALEDRQLAERLRPIVPHGVGANDDVTAMLARVLRESSAVVAALAIDDLRMRVGSLADASKLAERECRDRIAELEKDRSPDPRVFRAETLAALRPSLDKIGEKVVEHGLETLKGQLAVLRETWTGEIGAAVDRASAEAVIARINEEAPARLGAIVETVDGAMGKELQANFERLESWLLDEMSVRYKAQSAQLEGATVVSSDVSSDFGSVRKIPLAAVVDRFEHKRVGIGLGGAAAGAAIGTLVLPGIGTAVGAFVGVFAGFFEGVGTLKQDAVTRIGAHLDAVEKEARERLGAAGPSFAGDLHASLTEALDGAFTRRTAWITELLAREGAAIRKETAKLATVAELRRELETKAVELAVLGTDVANGLSELAAERLPRTRGRGVASTAREERPS